MICHWAHLKQSQFNPCPILAMAGARLMPWSSTLDYRLSRNDYDG